MLLKVENLTVHYGMARALENVSFKVNEGEIVALLGPNGAGKSTALKAVSGILQANGGRIVAGEIVFGGEDIRGQRTDQLARKGLCLVPEGRRVFPSLTVMGNLEMGGYANPDAKSVRKDIERVLAMFPRLRERSNQKAGTLSSGEQQMLAIGRAMMLQPKLLMADEPSLGLSPNFVGAIFEHLVAINQAGTSILLVEQNAYMALQICHRAYLFEAGRIAFQGSRSDLLADERVKAVYLGG
jgi:branched-chain amino acid transport system ATP-binding protein